jgi:hypothetical protein
MLLRWLVALLGGKRKKPLNSERDGDPELEAAQLLLAAAGRVDLPGPCIAAVGQALVELSRTLPNPAEDGL